jgi:hypothetical protein
MPLFNVLKFNKIQSLAMNEIDHPVNLSALEYTFLLNLLANIPWTEKDAAYAIWIGRGVMSPTDKDTANELIDGLMRKFMG